MLRQGPRAPRGWRRARWHTRARRRDANSTEGRRPGAIAAGWRRPGAATLLPTRPDGARQQHPGQRPTRYRGQTRRTSRCARLPAATSGGRRRAAATYAVPAGGGAPPAPGRPPHRRAPSGAGLAHAPAGRSIRELSPSAAGYQSIRSGSVAPRPAARTGRATAAPAARVWGVAHEDAHTL